MNRRGFLGILAKGAIVASMPLSAEAAIKSIADNPSNSRLKLMYEFMDFNQRIAAGIEVKRTNGELYRSSVLMDAGDFDPGYAIDILWTHIKQTNPEIIRGLRKPTAKEHLAGVEEYIKKWN